MNFPILSTLIFLPLISSFFILLSRDKTSNNSSIYISLFSSIATFFLSLFLWYSLDLNVSEFQFVEEKSWVNNFIKFKLGVDGISILFIVLTTFITPICIISCVNSVKVRVKEFLIAILILETFMIGVFCSLDLVIFYLFFEAGLIPMFLIIGVWGGPKRVYSAFKFFLNSFWKGINPIGVQWCFLDILLSNAVVKVQISILRQQSGFKLGLWKWFGFKG